jgi:hypothetical protein
MTMNEIVIIRLDYSERQRLFHYEDNPKATPYKDWVMLAEKIDLIDAEKFYAFMEKKYCSGRVSGQMPTLDIVKLELQLFFKLKNVKRKLV